jgi:hypothetical protein
MELPWWFLMICLPIVSIPSTRGKRLEFVFFLVSWAIWRYPWSKIPTISRGSPSAFGPLDTKDLAHQSDAHIVLSTYWCTAEQIFRGDTPPIERFQWDFGVSPILRQFHSNPGMIEILPRRMSSYFWFAYCTRWVVWIPLKRWCEHHPLVDLIYPMATDALMLRRHFTEYIRYVLTRPGWIHGLYQWDPIGQRQVWHTGLEGAGCHPWTWPFGGQLLWWQGGLRFFELWLDVFYQKMYGKHGEMFKG